MKTISVALAMVLVLLFPTGLCAQTEISSSMDWSTGEFSVSASRPLDSGMAPSDHPRALAALERELQPLVVEELGQMSWDRDGTLNDLMSRLPNRRTSVEDLALALDRAWSRLSADRKSVEAEYTVNLFTIIDEFFPPENPGVKREIPVEWIPVPEDPWTGIVIYAPKGLPVRGTGLSADPLPALRARILGDSLQVLADPAAEEFQPLAYQVVDYRAEFDDRVGRRPYRTMARALYGESPCDIILGEEDARRIMASESGRQALNDGRIVILLDP